MTDKELLESLIGKTKEDAKEICDKLDYVIRVTREDSNNYVGTCDFRVDRVNLGLDNDIITDCGIG